jgi:uncharacterized HAD superfamily protein
MKHIKIGVDMDEVLVDINQAMIDGYNEKHGTNFQKKDVKSFFLEELFGCTKEEMFEFMEEFFFSEHHKEAAPLIGAIEGIEQLKVYDLVLITARPEHVRSVTEEWLAKHFPNTFSEIHLIGDSIGLGGMKQTKGDMAIVLGIQIFIEDSLSNAKNIAAKGIPVVLIDAPWNQGDLPDDITRAFSWEEIVEHVTRLIKK